MTQPKLNKEFMEILDAFDVANSDTSASYEEVREQAVKEIMAWAIQAIPIERKL